MTGYEQFQPCEYQLGSTATFRTVMAEVTRLYSDSLCEVWWMQHLEKNTGKHFQMSSTVTRTISFRTSEVT